MALSVKGAKKGRRMGRPRSDASKRLCANRKEIRKAAQVNAAQNNVASGNSPWKVAKEARRARRKSLL